MKRVLIVFGSIMLGLAAFVLIVIAIFPGVPELISKRSNPGEIEIGKRFTIVLEESEVRDFTCLQSEAFSLLSTEELSKLEEYMKTNSLIIKAGAYDFNQTNKFRSMKKILRFEKQ